MRALALLLLSTALVPVGVPVLMRAGDAKAATTSYTVNVGGDTIEITPSDLSLGKQNSYSWSVVSGSSHIKIEQGSSEKTVTVEGVSTGTATLSLAHGYGKNSNHLSSESKTYTVEVVDPSEKTLMAADADDEVEVTVKETGTAKQLDRAGLKLVVEKLKAGSDDYADYERALESVEGGDVAQLAALYHIYVADASGEEVSVKNANLVVTVMDPSLKGLSTVRVAHFKKSGNTVTDQGIDGMTGLKRVTVSDGSITFKIKSFSVFAVQRTSGSSGSGASGTGKATHGDDLTAEDSWQMVSKRYDGNGTEAKEMDTSGNVALQKNVLPVRDSNGNLKENEFLVYLSIDRILDTQKYFSGASVSLVHRNNYEKGDVVSSPGSSPIGAGNVSTAVVIEDSALDSAHRQLARFTIKTQHFSNSTAYIQMPNGKWICLGNRLNSGSTITLDLAGIATSNSASFYESLLSLDSLTSVTDTLNSEFVYEGLYESDSVDGSVSERNGVLTWTISDATADAMKTSVQYARQSGDSSKLSYLRTLVGQGDGNGKVRLENDAELVYRVKLAPRASSVGAGSQLDAIADTTASGNAATGKVKVSSNALLSYKPSSSSAAESVSFPEPEVRGMLYDIQVSKTDDRGNALAGATFELTGSGVNGSGSYGPTRVVSDASGAVTFSGLLYGSYTLTEVSAPAGYALDKTTSWSFTIPENAPADGSLVASPADSTHWLWNTPDGGIGALSVANARIDLTVIKLAADAAGNVTDTPLSGARFGLYADAECASLVMELTTGEGGTATDTAIAAGTYYLKENRAPAGYQLDGRVYEVTVSPTALGTVGGAPNYIALREAGSANGPQAPMAAVNTIVVADRPNAALPSTAGSGLAWLVLVEVGASALGAGAALLCLRARKVGRS